MSASTVMSPLLARCAAASRRSLGVKPMTRPAAMRCTHTLSTALQGTVSRHTRLLALTWAPTFIVAAFCRATWHKLSSPAAPLTAV